MLDYPRPPFAEQKQPVPGITDAMTPVPDHGEKSYKGNNRLNGKKAVITGADVQRLVGIIHHDRGAQRREMVVHDR